MKKGSMHHFQSYPIVFLQSRHMRARRHRTRKQAAPVVLVSIVLRRGVARQLELVLELDEDAAGGFEDYMCSPGR